ncbi:MAG TPA: type II toxin-antitoxin system VapC family toxin [Rhizomicrobium sp.]|nr:type II toxin-antitoxin system VapC family toxin [Rhizomicrobium sp.]
MIVVDASVALKWVLPEEDSSAAHALLESELAAPDFWIVEIANALWRRTLQRELSQKEAARRLAWLRRAPVLLLPASDHVEDAFRIAADLKHPLYDCIYLATAMREETQFVTADTRFARTVRIHSKFRPYIRLLREDGV